MVVLNPAQKALIEQLQGAKKAYDRNKELLSNQFEVALNAAKDPIRQLVAQSVGSEIPVRQIHQNGLGMAQVATMKTFLQQPQGTLVQQLLSPVGPVNPNPGVFSGVAEAFKPVISYSNNTYTFTDAQGEPQKVTMAKFGHVRAATTFAWEQLSESGKQIILDEYKWVLISSEELKAYTNDGRAPERWPDEPSTPVASDDDDEE